MLAAFRQLRGRPWSLLSDRRLSHAQPDEVQAIIVEVMTRATALGRVKAAVLVEDAVARLQMRRLAAEASNAFVQRVFADEEEAMAWLAEAPPRSSGE